MLWGSVPIITLGLLLVAFALFKAPWPPDPSADSGWRTVSHLDRLRGKQAESLEITLSEKPKRSPSWYGRRVLDGAVYGLVVLGCVGIGLSLWRGTRRTSAFLTLIGGAGILYCTLVGLYSGPIIAGAGFALVLFGAGLSWASQCADDAHHHRAAWETAAQTGIGLNHHDTHVVA
jgi:hypothetical protein